MSSIRSRTPERFARRRVDALHFAAGTLGVKFSFVVGWCDARAGAANRFVEARIDLIGPNGFARRGRVRGDHFLFAALLLRKERATDDRE